MDKNYPSCICNNCPATMYGLEGLSSHPDMSCERRWCQQAYEDYYEDNPDEEKLPMEELF